jgi:glyoxylase-like metal-dependent hydrolase (beta-lactamase superfamily II)
MPQLFTIALRWIAPLASILVAGAPSSQHAAQARLTIEQFTGDSNAFDVNSTLIIGPTELLLVDAQYLVKDANRIADRIAATGKHLKAIVLTHPDDDHYYGVATILQRFPGTPVYMSPTGIAEFTSRELPQFKALKARIAALPPQPGRVLPQLPDSLVIPEPFPARTLTVDGEEIQILPEVQGDVLTPCNTMFYIPSLGTLIAGDVVFNGVHVWLAASTVASRAAWQQVLARMAELQPAVVIAGHKNRVDAPDTPDVIAAMREYLTDFDAARQASKTAAELVAAMDRKYSQRAVHRILTAAAQHAFAP